jgi:hypothetical protein
MDNSNSAARRKPTVCDALAIFVRYCEEEDPAAAARGLTAREVAAARQCTAQIDSWLDRFTNSLPPATWTSEITSLALLAQIGERALANLAAQAARNRQRGDALRAEIGALIARHQGPKPMTAQQIRDALARENLPSVRRIQKHLKLLRAPSSVGRG